MIYRIFSLKVYHHLIINIRHPIVIVVPIIILHRFNRIQYPELRFTIKFQIIIIIQKILIIHVHFFFHQNRISEVLPYLLLHPLSLHHPWQTINNKFQLLKQLLNVNILIIEISWISLSVDLDKSPFRSPNRPMLNNYSKEMKIINSDEIDTNPADVLEDVRNQLGNLMKKDFQC